ncbi:phosphotransferase family protein [Halioxenophilus sp. WMMB6]|uniref:phosphotransferase family protein n=1 Tax=Halioxenophilus sp. WMMB6 TaxID=3073815 RepID=UPI00295E4A8A|nr:phosphotransferase family protein [Halioxenophilus sp. WMMB6]
MTFANDVLQGHLKSWLENKMPEAVGLEITGFEKTSSGTSNETWFLTINYAEQGKKNTEKMVVRWAPETSALLHTYNLREQFDLMSHLRASPVPVPGVYWFEDDTTIIGTSFFVMERIDGEVIDLDPSSAGFQKLCDATPAERQRLWEQLIKTIAQIHSLDWQALGLGFLRGSDGPEAALDSEIGWWEDFLHYSKVEMPVFHKAFEWLRIHKPVNSGIGLCWGDARLGNLLFRDGDVQGVLDWEMAYIGPPECDVMYMCVMTETMNTLLGLPPMEGAMTTREVCDYYESVSDRKLANIEYHEFFATLKTAIGLCRAGKILEDAGIGGFPEGFFTNNPATRKLEQLLVS